MDKDKDKNSPRTQIIIALIGAAAVIIAAIISRPASPAEPTPTATLAPTQVSVKDTPVPASSDTATPAPSPTPSVTSEGDCSSGSICYQDPLETLDPAVWLDPSNEAARFESGRLILSAPAEVAHELHPQLDLDTGLEMVELELQLLESEGYPGNARAGIGAWLDDAHYLYFYLNTAGEVIVEHGPNGQSSEIDERVPLSDPLAPHRLRIAWSSGEAHFWVDGEKLSTTLPSGGPADWFLLTVSAWPDAAVTAALDSVSWQVRSP